jgi:alkaline phosphatase
MTRSEMNITLISLLLAVLTNFLISCNHSEKLTLNETPEIKNIILMIGDGMGLPDIYAAMTVSYSPLNIERCNIFGLQKTFSSDNYITDSGAAGTAMATGNKTINGAIGMDSQGNRVKSILEIAEEHGLATGLVSTSSITHATPASFIAHQLSRNSYEEIAMDFLKTDIDIFIGGGYDHFAKREDKLNLIDSLKFRNYEVDTSMNQVFNSTARKLAGLTAAVHNPYRLKGRGDMLPESAAKAIEVLSKNPKGFFLMIEGSEIDWAAHANTADTLIDETLDFDKAIGVALDFAKNDGHTLVVITADHETGGVTIIEGDIVTHMVKLSFSTINHTGVMVPVYAYGPGAEQFIGIYDNTDIFHKLMISYGF